MRRRWLWAAFGLVLLIGLGVVANGSRGSIRTQSSEGGLITVDQYVLHQGESYRGGLILFARDVTLEAGSTVQGNVTIFAQGTVTLDGRINGNLLMVGSTTTLGPNLEIQGNASICASNLKRADEARINGEFSTGCNYAPPAHTLPIGPLTGFLRLFANPVIRFFQITGTSLATAALAGLLAVLFPVRIRRARDAALSVPVTAGIVGVLTVGVAGGLTVVYGISLVLIITLILLPVVGLFWLALALLIFVGWVVVAEPVGRILLHRLNIYTVPMIAAVVGAFVMTLAVQLLSLVPCMGWLGWLLSVVMGSVGLGALLLTRLGRRSYPSLSVRRIELV